MIGIFGGTFDPIHYAHLRTALEVKEILGLEQLRMLPTNQPPHRSEPSASAAQRLKMLELALAHAESELIIDTCELHREGPSYMVDTLKNLKMENPASSFCLAVGFDAFLGFPRWHCWQELFELAHIAVMSRPGWQKQACWKDELATEVQHRQSATVEELSASAAGRVIFVEVTQLAISATQIRRLIATGKNPRFLLPDPVLAYIDEVGLYRPIDQTE